METEVKAYLDGMNLSQKSLRQIIFELARYFHEQGLPPYEIRTNILAWGERYNVKINLKLNGLIYKAINEK